MMDMAEYSKICGTCGKTYTLRVKRESGECKECKLRRYMRTMNEKIKERMKTDPEYKEKQMKMHRESIKKWNLKRLKDPVYKERMRKHSYEYWASHHNDPEYRAKKNEYAKKLREEDPIKHYTTMCRCYMRRMTKEQRHKLVAEIDGEKKDN
jgi:hypothetical protein